MAQGLQLAAATATARYATNEIHPVRRLAQWNQIASSIFGGLHIEARPNSFSYGELIRLDMGGCELLIASSSPARITRPPATRLVNLHEDTLGLELVCKGRCRQVLAGAEILLHTGDFVLHDPRASYFSEFDEPIVMAVILLPVARYSQRQQHLVPHLNRRMDCTNPAAAVFSKFLRSTVQDILNGYQQCWAPSLSAAICNLLDLVYKSDQPVNAGPGRRIERLRAAQRLVERELCNPDLSVQTIASSLHVSDRYIQVLFHDLDTTPTKYILDRRLDIAAERLRLDTAQRISDIAMSVGFSDLAYFSRAFHRRFGMPARSFRQQI